MPTSLDRSDQTAASASPGSAESPVQPCQATAKRYAVEVRVEGVDGKPVSGIQVRLERSESEIADQLSGSYSNVRFDGLQPGSYSLTLPALDAEAWNRISEQPVERPASDGDLVWASPSKPAQSPSARTIAAGDCLAKVAYELGYAQDTIWNFGSNESLRNLRKNRYILEAGDVLQIPPRRLKRIPASTGNLYVVQLVDVPEILKIRFVTFSLGPRANVDYLLHIESASGAPVPDRKGTTNSDGFLIESIPPDAIRAEVWFGTGKLREVYPVDLGRVDPLDSIGGLQGRLRNLSYLAEFRPGELDENTREALRRFQADNRLDVTGEPDAATRAKLEEIFLS